MTYEIRSAVLADAARLTEIAFAAKRHWNYPEHYIERWKDELTITEGYISDNIVRCISIANRPVGFYSLVVQHRQATFGEIEMEAGPWLDHMFLVPELHCQGLGTAFFGDLRAILAKEFPGQPLRIFVDPNAVGFYERMGAKFERRSASSIPGREIPVFTYEPPGA